MNFCFFRNEWITSLHSIILHWYCCKYIPVNAFAFWLFYFFIRTNKLDLTTNKKPNFFEVRYLLVGMRGLFHDPPFLSSKLKYRFNFNKKRKNLLKKDNFMRRFLALFCRDERIRTSDLWSPRPAL